MVTVNTFEQRKNAQGESFLVLILTGDLAIVTSKNTGKPYATVHKMSIPATFDESVAKTLVGKQIKGEIQRIECEPYEYVSKTTGDVLTLNHTYVYNPNPSDLVQTVIEGSPAF